MKKSTSMKRKENQGAKVYICRNTQKNVIDPNDRKLVA